jgi:hypothetical protein
MEEVRAQAMEEGKRIATLQQKEADVKIRKAEEEARAAEDRAKQATTSVTAQDEANKARERVKILKAVAGGTKPSGGSNTKPEATQPSAAGQATATPQSGRRIRTEL